jgi:hypothetical protein
MFEHIENNQLLVLPQQTVIGQTSTKKPNMHFCTFPAVVEEPIHSLGCSNAQLTVNYKPHAMANVIHFTQSTTLDLARGLMHHLCICSTLPNYVQNAWVQATVLCVENTVVNVRVIEFAPVNPELWAASWAQAVIGP